MKTAHLIASCMILSLVSVAFGQSLETDAAPTSTTLSSYRQNISQHITEENQACSNDTKREVLLQKHGSYITNLSPQNQENCLVSLQNVEILRCEQILRLLNRDLKILEIKDLQDQLHQPGFSNERLSQKVIAQLVQEVQNSRTATTQGIENEFRQTRCPLLQGFTGYFAKRNLLSALNRKLDEMIADLQRTHLVFDREI